MNPKLKEKIYESLSAVLPITGIVLLISILLVPVEIGTMVMFITGALMLVVGMGVFQLGAEMAMTPLGEGIGVQISKTRNFILICLIGFSMGAIITISEPDLQVLAQQVPSIPNYVLILTVAVGVGIFLAMAICRILFQINLSTILIVLYIILIGMSLFIEKDFLAVAFDSGGVTTGPMTVPFIMAMGVGLASVRGDRNASSDSFGLVALSSVGPVLAVLILGSFYNPTQASYSSSSVANVVTTRDVVWEFMTSTPPYIKEVLISLVPVAAVFAIFQLLSRRYQQRQVKRVLVGFGYTYIGLVLFLCGVNVGFAPVGSSLGKDIAAADWRWLSMKVVTWSIYKSIFGMAPHTYRYAYRVLYRKSGAGHSGVKSPGRGCNERSGIGKRDEPVSVHRRFRQRRAYDAAGADRAAHLLDCHSRLYHRADFIETCSEDVCRYCI